MPTLIWQLGVSLPNMWTDHQFLRSQARSIDVSMVSRLSGPTHPRKLRSEDSLLNSDNLAIRPTQGSWLLTLRIAKPWISPNVQDQLHLPAFGRIRQPKDYQHPSVGRQAYQNLRPHIPLGNSFPSPQRCGYQQYKVLCGRSIHWACLIVYPGT